MTPADRERQIRGLVDYLPKDKRIDCLREMIERGVADPVDRQIIRRIYLDITEPNKGEAA